MKILFKCLFFILLILKISNAMASNYVYNINKDHNYQDVISVCGVDSLSGRFIRCVEIKSEHFGIDSEPTKIAVSPDGAYAYIATASDMLYACLIDNDTGILEDCTTQHRFSMRSHGPGSISSIAVNANNDKIYIISVYNHHQVTMCMSKTLDCRTFGEFSGGSGSSSSPYFKFLGFIAISSNDKYAYLLETSGRLTRFPYKSSILVCLIQPDGTFDYNNCQKRELNDVPEKIKDMTITKDRMYFVVGNHEHDLTGHSIKSCPLDEDGKLGPCTAVKTEGVIKPKDKLAQIVFDNANKFAYIISNNRNYIIRCQISDTGFKNCEKETGGFSDFLVPGVIAYRNVGHKKDETVTFYRPH